MRAQGRLCACGPRDRASAPPVAPSGRMCCTALAACGECEMTRSFPSFLGWCVCGVAVVLGAQQAPSPRQSPPFSAVTTAITVDVVVRDKRGKPVTDLHREDFALFEDDVRQDVADMTLVAPAANRLSGSPGNAESGFGKSVGPTADSSRTTIAAPTFVAIVFDRLTPEARALAYRGAQEYLASETGSDFAGVFVSDMSLLTLQAYTNDRAQVARACAPPRREPPRSSTLKRSAISRFRRAEVGRWPATCHQTRLSSPAQNRPAGPSRWMKTVTPRDRQVLPTTRIL